MDEITLTIDGREAKGKRGDTILAVCERNGIDVPTLCHNENLGDIGACRLCVVEIEGARGLSTACTTPASSGMVVRTDTPALNSLRKSVLELLFAERNHFCMFCEMSGDCELQALGYRFGIDAVRYSYAHPRLEVDSSSPYFILDHNRCVLCRRCVRACSELVGVSALGYKERGAKTMVMLDLDAPVAESTCEACGVCVQLCPTGALFDRRSAYKGHLADCTTVPTACRVCGVGCQMEARVRAGRVLRLDGDFAGASNRGLLCAKGRYEALGVPKERLLSPQVRRNGTSVAVGWPEALDYAARLLSAAKADHGHDGVTAVVTADATNETLYLLNWVFRGAFGGNYAVIGARQAVARSAALKRVTGGDVTAEADFEAIPQADFILLFGADPARTHPVLASAIRRAVGRGNARLMLIGAGDNALASHACLAVTPRRGSEGILANGLMNILVGKRLVKQEADSRFAVRLSAYSPRTVEKATDVAADDMEQIARGLASASQPLVIYGGTVLNGADRATSVLSLAVLLGHNRHSKVPALGLAIGTNGVAAARLAGDRLATGLTAARAAFVALGDAPVGDLVERLNSVESLVVQASYPSPLTERADVVLPARLWTERHGTFIAGDGSQRTSARLVSPPVDIPDDLELIAMLGSRLGAAASFADAALPAKIEQAFAMAAASPDQAAPVCVNYL
ncbi:MAG: molybdopterin-dependent oxidoreductase [Chloroflexota bacterium]